MSNIERRRKKRVIFTVGAAALALLAVGGIVALALILGNKQKKREAEPYPTAQAATAAPATEAPATAVPVTEAPATAVPATEAPATAAPETTDEPVETEPAAETPEPSSTETADDTPVRISDEQSEMLLEASVVTRYDQAGMARFRVEGRLSLLFVNNTDRSLYELDLDLGGLSAERVLLDGSPANFRIEGGTLIVPFLNDLPTLDENTVFIEFSAELSPGESFAVPKMCYDTSYILTAYITSDVGLRFSGCRAVSSAEGGKKLYTVSEASVRAVEASFVY